MWTLLKSEFQYSIQLKKIHLKKGDKFEYKLNISCYQEIFVNFIGLLRKLIVVTYEQQQQKVLSDEIHTKYS